MTVLASQVPDLNDTSNTNKYASQDEIDDYNKALSVAVGLSATGFSIGMIFLILRMLGFCCRPLQKFTNFAQIIVVAIYMLFGIVLTGYFGYVIYKRL